MKINQKILIETLRFFAICSCFILTSCRHLHRLHRSEELKSKNECFYTNTNIYQSFSEWMNKKNGTDYAFISPYNQELFDIKSERYDGASLSTKVSSCKSRKASQITSEMPLHEQALCPFEYVLNYDPKRMPSTLVEAKCSCPNSTPKLAAGHSIECQPLKYDVRVLLFNEECTSFIERVETITVACISVIKPAIKESDFVMTEIEADIPAKM